MSEPTSISKAKKLRKLFEAPGLIRLVGAHNGLTARLIEQHGFEGVWASSLEISASHAVPDANILTMDDYLYAARSMHEATAIPVVADVDQGYGNAMNVIRMVQKYESAGIAGVVIEDKQFPKQNSLLKNGRHPLASVPEFVGKIKAAKQHQRDPDFMVIARVEALIAGMGMDEALDRALAYAAAGADAILIHSKKKSPDEIIAFIERWEDPTPLVLVPTTYPSMGEAVIARYETVKVVIYANHVIRAAIKSIKNILAAIGEKKGIHKVDDKLVPVDELFGLQGTYAMMETEKEFLAR